MWGIVITVRPSSPLNFYILIFISETTGPIGTKLSRNVDWVVLYNFFPPILNPPQEKKRSKPWNYILSLEMIPEKKKNYNIE
jgi:hypothetical protein